VLDYAQNNVPCPRPGCHHLIEYADLKRIASANVIEQYVHNIKKLKVPLVLMIYSYDWLIRRKNAKETGERECLADVTDAGGNRVSCHHFQKHDIEDDGRLFVCKACGNEECVRCGIFEHKNEICEAFQTRLASEHGEEDCKTAKMLKEGYDGLEFIGQSGKMGMKFKKPKPCPRCGQLIERDKG
jgi:hypothetical protein